MKKLFSLILLASSIAMSQFTVGSRISVPTLGINSVDSTNIKNGTIVNADINANANIAGSKLADNGITYAKLDTGATGFVDVRKFGATGDGVTDDTDAIQAAIDYAHWLGGGTVFFPNGTYLISKKKTYSCLTTYGAVKLVGSGARNSGLYSLTGGATLLMAANQNTCMIVNDDYEDLMDGETPGYWHYGSIEKLTFFCNGDSNMTEAGGIKIYRAGESSYIKDVNVQSFRDTAIVINTSTPALLENIACFPATNAGTSERVAMKLTGRTCRVIAPSGDNCNPYFYIHGDGSVVIVSPKLEFNGSSYGNPAMYIKSKYTAVPSVNVVGGSFWKIPTASRYGDMVYIESDSVYLGKVQLSGVNVSGFKNILKSLTASVADSIYRTKDPIYPGTTPNYYVDQLIWGNGINYIGGDYTYGNGVFKNESPVFNTGGFYTDRFYSPYLSIGEKQNYLKQSEDLSKTWAKAGTGASDSIIVTTNVVNAPNGTLTADMVNNTCKLTGKYIYQNTTDLNPSKGEKAILSFWCKGSGSIVGKTLTVYLGFYGGSTENTIDYFIIPDTWELFHIKTRCKIGSHTGTQVRFDTPVEDDSLYIWGTQLNSGWQLYPYTTTTTAAITSGSQAVGGNIDFKRISASDSATVGAGGIWQRNWYYNAADSSVRIIFYNSVLSRIDTVKCPQAN